MKEIIKVKMLGRLWSIRFLPPHLMRDGENGTCWTSKQCIDIDNSMAIKEIKLILTHELTHAYIGMCGQCYCEKLDQENVCEFVAWNIDEIIEARNKVIKEYLGSKNP